MLATRLSQRVRAVARGLHSQASSAASKSHGWRAAAVASVAAATTAAFAYAATSRSPVACESSSSSAGITATAAQSVANSDEVRYYVPTFSRRASLPQTEAEIRSHSLADLAKVYDPTPSTLAHEVVAGGPPQARAGLAPLDLLFTADDADPQHRHMELLVRTIQDRICNDLLDVERLGGAGLERAGGVELTDQLRTLLTAQTTEPGQFRQDIVIRPNHTGGGVTRVLNGGRVFSKAGVSVSVAQVSPPTSALIRMQPDHPRLGNLDPTKPVQQFTAAVSLVLHPVSPHVPTVHANWRFFDLVQDGKHTWWFGGGSDLTPTYVVDGDAQHFHRTLKAALDPLDPSYYPDWKKWADEYFRLPHRNETRGVGGVFFDDQHTKSFDEYERAVRRMGESFSAQYFPIVLKNKDLPFDESDLSFQQLRRGRYAEFNLVYDKGTTYGLKMVNSRPDAVLMSLPAISRWTYKQPFSEVREQYTKEVLTSPKEWA